MTCTLTMLVSDEVKIAEVEGGVDDKVKPIGRGPRSFFSPLADA